MAGRSCKICASAASIKIAAEMIAAGATDGAIAAQSAMSAGSQRTGSASTM